MEYKQLNRIRDTYPGNSDDISDSYTSDASNIQLTGLYPQNFIRFDIVDISNIIVPDIQISPAISFEFIVRFETTPIRRSIRDGSRISVEEWTSPGFLQKLKSARQENNPYFTKDKITIATVDFNYLSQYWKKSEFKVSELYANVEVTDTISTKEDMLIHINWMVSGQEDLRSVRDFGKWVVSLTDSLGFEYSDQIDVIQRGEPIIITSADRTSGNTRSNTSSTGIRVAPPTTPRRDNTNILLGGGTDTVPRGRGSSTPRNVRMTTPIRTRNFSTNTDYPPFNTAGRYTGETRTLSGTALYIWDGNRWSKM